MDDEIKWWKFYAHGNFVIWNRFTAVLFNVVSLLVILDNMEMIKTFALELHAIKVSDR